MNVQTPSRSGRAGRLTGLALALGAALIAGCAAPQPAAPSGAVAATSAEGAAPRITVPAVSVGTWYDLGAENARWLAGDAPVPVNGATAPTRAVGLQRDDGRWLAIVVVQTAPSSLPVAVCPMPANELLVESATGGSDCLRLRRDADFDGWLAQQHGVLAQWLDARGLSARPRAWVAHRIAGGAAGVTEVHALLDPSLLEPATRNNIDFLAAGQPGFEWARQLAAANRATGSGVLAVPPFPYAPRLALPSPPARVTPLAPRPRPPGPVLAPRRERG